MSRKILIRLVEKDKDALDRQDFLEVRLIENSFDRVFRFHLSDKCDSKILLDVVQHGVQYAIDSLEGACNAEMAVDAVSDVECIDRVKILHKNGHYSRLCAAAEHFGLDAQKQKTKEEMDELAELLGDYSLPDRVLRAARIEELADVYNMLDQLCILWNCEDEVRDMAKQKMIRTMERIESGYYDEA